MKQLLHRKFILLGLVILIAVVSYALWNYFTPVMNALKDPEQVRAWANAQGMKGRLIFMLAMALQVVLAVIPAGPMEIASGYAYGPWEGTLISTFGILLGSATAFALIHHFGERIVYFFFSENKLNNIKIFANENRLYRLTFIIFLIPGTPKDLLTYFLGLTKMSLKTFLVITTLARIPATFVSTFGGHALVSRDYGTALTIFAIVSILSIIGYIAYFKYNEHKKRQLEKQ